jgi:hypothetical protein
MRRILLSSLVFVCLAVSLQASEPFVVLVDEQRCLLLIPEGTAVPTGIEFTYTPDVDAPRSPFAANAAGVKGAAPQRWVYAYAAPEKFTEARRRIAEAEAKFPPPTAEQAMAGDRRAVGMQTGTARLGRVGANLTDVDETYYYYFWDGSYHAVRKYIDYQTGGWAQYFGHGYAYSEAGDWDTKVVVTDTSATHSGWNQSKTCWYYNASGTCLPGIYTYHTPYAFSGSLTSQAALTRYLYPPCDYPCKSNSSSTISISFP